MITMITLMAMITLITFDLGADAIGFCEREYWNKRNNLKQFSITIPIRYISSKEPKIFSSII